MRRPLLPGATRPMAVVACAAFVTWATASSAFAFLYTVDRAFETGSSRVVVQGTLEIPIGSYTITDKGPSPFTAVDLTLRFNQASYRLTKVYTDRIYGSGQFLIDASVTGLAFNTAFADGFNPADLIFSDSYDPGIPNNYAVGYDAIPGFENASTRAGGGAAVVTFPFIFATVIPEPSVASLLIVGCFLFRFHRQQQRWY